MIGPRLPFAEHPCSRHGCTACCWDTTLSLLEEDIARLELAGHRDFTVADGNGYLRLATVDGHCVFLSGGACSVYPIRPDGCRTYPLVYYEEEDRVDFDTFCPHWREFAVRPGVVLRVLRSVGLDDREALWRRRLWEIARNSRS